jgi:integrase
MKQLETLFKDWSKTKEVSIATKQSAYKAILSILKELNHSDYSQKLNAVYDCLSAMYSESTRNTYIRKAVSPFINWLKDESLLAADYKLPIYKKFSKQIVKKAKVKTLTPDQIEAIRSNMSDDDNLVTDILQATAIRPIEITRAVIDNSSMVVKGKGKERLIEVEQTVADKAKSLVNVDIYGYLRRFAKSCKKIGLTKGYGAYCLRRSFITARVKAGVPVQLIADYCGNSAQIIIKNYYDTNYLHKII